MMGPFGKFGSLEAWFIRRPSGRTIAEEGLRLRRCTHDSRFTILGGGAPGAAPHPDAALGQRALDARGAALAGDDLVEVLPADAELRGQGRDAHHPRHPLQRYLGGLHLSFLLLK